MELGAWRCPRSETLSDAVERNLGVTDYLLCNYRRESPQRSVNVYVGYHERQGRSTDTTSPESAIHPPKHCLPGSGWDIVDARDMEVAFAGLPGRRATINRFSIAKGNRRQIVYYWYQSRGRVIHRDWQKVVAMAWDRGTRGRTDGSLVRLTVPFDGDDDLADALFNDLAAVLVGELGPFVPE